ncbi:MAG: hypothetical protein AB7P13_05540 [Candidatus Nitrosocosmicus sp.]|nr:hypothetical protein YTPLAS21_09300 [Candidatus Nitrosocosmicus sp.]
MAKEDQASTFVENILNILSNLPTGLRNPIVKNRLKEFLSFENDERKVIIQDIFANYSKINNESLMNLIESWLNSLSEMRTDQINSIFYQYLIEISLNPSLLDDFKSDFVESISKILISFPEKKRKKLFYCFFEMTLNMPNPRFLIKVIPSDLLI